MHILLIHQAFAALDEPGGTRHHELARYLAARGHRVTVIASPVSYLTGESRTPNMVEQAQDGAAITILRPRIYAAWHRSFFHRVLSFLSFMLSSFAAGWQVNHVDVVWGTSPPIFQGGSAWLLARLKRARFLFEVRDLWPAFAVGMGVLKNPLLIRLAEAFEGFLYRHADQIMVNSPGFVSHIRARTTRPIELIPNGADCSMFNPSDDGAHFRAAHNLTGKFIALYAGAHGISNDLGIVLQAAQQLRAHSNIALVLLGDGKEKPALMQQAQQMGLNNVHFIASIPKTEMPTAIAAANACIAILKPIELYQTVYPNKVFDYMAAARPTLLAIGGVIADVMQQAQGGILIPPGDPSALAQGILQLANNPTQAQTLGTNARRYVETHFDRPVLAAQLEQLLKRMVEQ
ncbi:MAG: glycosyltransferase family 4 protein [Anaerolineales bacterium]